MNLNRRPAYTGLFKTKPHSVKPLKSPFGAFKDTAKPAGGQGAVAVPGSESAPKVQAPDESWKDSTYNDTNTNIQTGLKNLGAYLVGQGQGLGAEYGVNVGDADPTTYDPAHPPDWSKAIDWEHVDVTNPNSRAALLVRVHNQNARGNTNSMAARGQLYSGALQNAQDTENSNYGAGQNALISDFGQKYGGLYGQWLQGQQTADTQRLDNTSAAQGRHENDPATPPPINPALIEWFKTHGLQGDQWVAAPDRPATVAAKPPAAPKVTTQQAKDFFATHVLKGGRWVLKK